MKVLLRKGNRLFTFTWVFFLFGALAHSGAQIPEDDEALTAVVDAMKGYTFVMGEMEGPSFMDLFVGVWFQITGLMVGMGLTNLAVFVASGGAPAVKRVMQIAGLCVFVPLTILFVVKMIAPALIVFGGMSVLLVLDLVLSFRSSGEAMVVAE